MVHIISADAFLQKRSESKDSVLVVDVRDDAEYKTSHIAGALNVPITAQDSELEALLQKQPTDVVFYCLIGMRSAKLAERFENLLNQSGDGPKPKVHLLDGSLSAWALAGRPVVDSDGNPTRNVNLDKAPAHIKEQFASAV